MGAKTQHDFVLVGKDRASKVIKGVAKTTDSLIDSTFKLTGIISNSINIVGGMASAMGKLASVMRQPIQLAAEQARVEAQLDAVLRSTGEAAGLNAEQLKTMAAEMQRSTQFGDEAVIGMQNLLLTFTNIGGSGGIFERTTKVALDVSTAMGMDLKSSALQLGKALNDPATGLSMLTRVGITFSEEQKAVIKQLQATGDMAGAQTVILQELERQFGGSAEAMRDTFAGSVEAAQNSFGDLQEQIGRLVIENPVVTAAIQKFSDFVAELGAGVAGTGGKFSEAGEFLRDLVKNGVDLAVQAFAVAIDAAAYLADTLAGNTGLSFAIGLVKAAWAALEMGVKVIIAAFQATVLSLQLVWAALNRNWEAVDKYKQQLKDLGAVVMEDAVEANEKMYSAFEKGNPKAAEAAAKLRELSAGVRDFASKATEASAEATEYASELGEVAAAASEAAAAQEGLNDALGKGATDDLKAINREVFVYLDALKASSDTVGDLGRRETSRYLELRKNLEDLPLDQQIAEVQVFEKHLENLWKRAVGGSAETAAAMGQVSKAVEEVAEDAEKAAPKVERSFSISIGGIIDAIKKIVPQVVKETKRAERKWERSAERMGGSLADSLNSAYKDAITGQATLFDGLQNFSDTFKASLTSAFMDPILGAQSPLAELFTAALSPVAALGASISDLIFRPLIDGILTYFGVKEAAEAADGIASAGVAAGTATAITGTQMASVAAMLPGLFTAASLALVSTFGGAAGAAGLLPGVVSSALGQAKAAQAMTLTGFEDGGFIDREQVVRVGERDRPEVIIPLTKPDRARALLAEMFARNPELMSPMASAGGARGGRAQGSTFNITINGATDPLLTSTKVAQKIDLLLGRRIRGGVS